MTSGYSAPAGHQRSLLQTPEQLAQPVRLPSSCVSQAVAPLAEQHRSTQPLRNQQRSQQLRQLRQVVLQAVRADQQGQQTDSATLQLISEITSRVDESHDSILEQGARSSEGYVDPGADNELKAKVYGSISQLSQGLLERETEVGSLGN